MNDKRIHRLAFWAAFAGLIGVAFGAFGAHFLKSRIPPESLEVIKTGVLYLFVHVLATLVAISIYRQGNATRLIVTAGTLFMTGVLLFSGSLFLIGTSPLTGLPPSYIGFITPLGGLCFIAGWICFAIWALRAIRIH